MTAAPDADWRQRAACTGRDTALWFPKIPIGSPAMQICGGCPVRAECLYDALQHETPGARPHGIRGGLTPRARQKLHALTSSKPDAIAALREHLAVTQTNHQLPAERTPEPMTITPAPPVVDVQLKTEADVRLKEPEELSVGQLLKWGDEHTDAEIRDQAARARATLAGLRARHAADQELTAITDEAEQLEKRLAELRAREAELAPRTKKKRGSYARDYDTREVRAWADANGIDCPRVGQLPRRVLDAWRAATTPASA